MERYRQDLINVCRIGGKRFTSLSTANQYPAREFATELKTCFEVDVEKDEDGVHPPSICVVWRRVVHRCRDAAVAGRSFVPVGARCDVPQSWTKHNRTKCDFCPQLSSVSSGARPKQKRKSLSPLLAGSAEAHVELEQVKEDASEVTMDIDPPFYSAAQADQQAPGNVDSAAVVSPGKEVQEIDGENLVPGADVDISDIFKVATPDFKPSEDSILSPDRLSYPLGDISCVVCMHILNQAVESSCYQQLFLYRMHLDVAECFLTMSVRPTQAYDLVALHPRVSGIPSQIQVPCDFVNTERLGGTSRVPFCSLKLHVTGCAFSPGDAPHSPLRKVLTPSSGVEDTLTSSLSQLRGDVTK